MIGLFCSDGPLYKDKNGIYCSATFTNEVFSRYFAVVDKLVIMIRTFNSEKTYKELNMKPLTISNIEVIELANFNSIKGFTIDKKKFEKSLTDYLYHVDLIFARMPSNSSNSVLRIAQKIGKPHLVEVGGCAWDSFWNHGLSGKAVALLMFVREKKYVAGADFATYVTKNFLQERYPNNNTTMNCSDVCLQPLEECILSERLEKIKLTNINHLIFGQSVNSVDVKYKGEHLFIKAMGTLKKKGVIVEYQIVGMGEGNYIKLQAEKYGVADQVKLLGTMKKEEIFTWLKSIDVYVQPSKQEGLPRSVLEAMSMGCPALGSDIAGIPELLEKDCLFNPDKNDEIVSAVERIMDKGKLSLFAKTNFYKVREEYDMQKINDRRKAFFCLYRDFVRER